MFCWLSVCSLPPLCLEPVGHERQRRYCIQRPHGWRRQSGRRIVDDDERAHRQGSQLHSFLCRRYTGVLAQYVDTSLLGSPLNVNGSVSVTFSGLAAGTYTLQVLGARGNNFGTQEATTYSLGTTGVTDVSSRVLASNNAAGTRDGFSRAAGSLRFAHAPQEEVLMPGQHFSAGRVKATGFFCRPFARSGACADYSPLMKAATASRMLSISTRPYR